MPVYPFPEFAGALSRLNKVEIITRAAQLAGTLDSQTFYLIDGFVDTGDLVINVPENGLTLGGFHFATSKLYSSENNQTMFGYDGAYAGNINMMDVTLETSGTNSKVFDVDNDGNFGNLEFIRVNFENCNSLGNLTAYRQLLAQGCGFITYNDGFLADETWAGGFTIIDSIMLFAAASSTLLKAGPTLSVQGSFRSDLNAINSTNDDTSVITDMDPSHVVTDGAMALNGLRAKSSADMVPNFPPTSVKANFTDCIGISNTYPGCSWVITSQVTTTNPGVGTYVKVAGVTTFSDEAWFSKASDNAARYDSDQQLDVAVSGIFSIDGSNNHQIVIQLRQWDDSAAGYIDIGPEFQTTLNGGPSGSRGENTVTKAFATLNKNDRLEVWAKNITGAANWTFLVGSALTVQRR